MLILVFINLMFRYLLVLQGLWNSSNILTARSAIIIERVLSKTDLHFIQWLDGHINTSEDFNSDT